MPAGRPKKELDPKQVYKLARLQCTLTEMASFFEVDAKTITNNYSKEIAKGREAGKISLRRSQFKLAKTNGAVCIWLGKQYLGQREPKEEIFVNFAQIPNVDEMTDAEVQQKLEELQGKVKQGDSKGNSS